MSNEKIEIEKKLREFVNKNQQLLCNLYSRWQDEKEHEDIRDYGARLAKELPEGWKLERTTGRPFRFTINLGPVTYVISVTSRSISWKPQK